MNVRIIPHQLCGSIHAVSSKSHIHRLLLAAALANGKTEIEYCALSEDISATANAVCALGAKVAISETSISVCGIDEPAKHPHIDAAESGTTLRFLLPVAAALCESASFTGHGRLPQRPLHDLEIAMQKGGVAFSSDTLPFSISGRLCGGVYELRGDVSSQYISGLMFALPMLCANSEIRLTTSLESAPYVDMTADVLKDFGIEINRKENSFFINGNQQYRAAGKIAAAGDWSNAAFWLTANAICGNVSVFGLTNDSQGDRAICNALKLLSQDGEKTVNASQIPDLVPVISVFATSRSSVTRICGAARLKIKESDRLRSTAALICSLGGRAEETADGIVIYPQTLSGGTVCGFGDHRIVMAAAIASLLCENDVIIEGAEAVSKSYPSFFDDFRSLGGEANVM